VPGGAGGVQVVRKTHNKLNCDSKMLYKTPGGSDEVPGGSDEAPGGAGGVRAVCKTHYELNCNSQM
jgi:hypothetical protein